MVTQQTFQATLTVRGAYYEPLKKLQLIFHDSEICDVFHFSTDHLLESDSVTVTHYHVRLKSQAQSIKKRQFGAKHHHRP